MTTHTTTPPVRKTTSVRTSPEHPPQGVHRGVRHLVAARPSHRQLADDRGDRRTARRRALLQPPGGRHDACGPRASSLRTARRGWVRDAGRRGFSGRVGAACSSSSPAGPSSPPRRMREGSGPGTVAGRLSHGPLARQAAMSNTGRSRMPDARTPEECLHDDGPHRGHARHHVRDCLFLRPERHAARAPAPVRRGRGHGARRGLQRRRRRGRRRARLSLLHCLHHHRDFLRSRVEVALADPASGDCRSHLWHRRLPRHEPDRDSRVAHRLYARTPRRWC